MKIKKYICRLFGIKMTPIILYDNALTDSTITASTTANGFSVDFLNDYKTFTSWKAVHSTNNNLIIDLKTKKFIGAFAFVGHNLKHAKIKILKSDDGLIWNKIGQEFTINTSISYLKLISTEINEIGFLRESGDGYLMRETGGILLRESATKYYSRYWKIEFETETAPEIAVLFMGEYIQFEYPPEVPTVPIEERIVANSSDSNGGHLLGTDVRYHPQSSTLNFKDISRSFYQNRLKPFWDDYARWLNPFIVAWDLDNRPDDVFYCKVNNDSTMREPLSMLNNVDDYNIRLKVLM